MFDVIFEVDGNLVDVVTADAIANGYDGHRALVFYESEVLARGRARWPRARFVRVSHAHVNATGATPHSRIELANGLEPTHDDRIALEEIEREALESAIERAEGLAHA